MIRPLITPRCGELACDCGYLITRQQRTIEKLLACCKAALASIRHDAECEMMLREAIAAGESEGESGTHTKES